MLRELNLTAYEPNRVRIDFFCAIAPGLRKLRLYHISLKHWDSPFLFNLREFSLSGANGAILDQLLAVLEACVNLEKLSLTLVYTNDTSASEHRRTIDLLSLDSFFIYGLSPFF
ncbi:hypothetical protein FRB93_014030 [Tulasnella sp. JGI-2019a]|nr:hypothetical protein FRB93_014030 [Tulasnella sp. JGI-2019a]